MAKKPDFKIVELERVPNVPELNNTNAAAVAALRDHPGFQYLLAKLRLQKALLQTTLSTKRQASLRDVEFLQSGIVWCGWLEDQVSKAVGIQNRPQARPARVPEIEAFEQLQRLIDVVGVESSQETTPGFTAPQGQTE
jgi:hypothetical protein